MPARLVLALLSLLLPFAGIAHADDESPTLTRLERGRWLPADAIVRAQVQSVRDARAPGGTLGRQVVRAKAQQVFKGPLQAGQIFTIVVYGQRPTLDPSRPSVPYFRADKKSEHILFLERGSDAHAWSLQTLFDMAGPAGGEQLQAMATLASWRKETDIAAKSQRVLKDLLRMLTSGGSWTKTYAAREVAWLAESRPQIFDAKSRRTLQRVAPMGTSRDQRYWTRRALEILTAERREATDGITETDPWRRAFLAADDTEVRIKLLTRLHASGGTLFDANAWWAWRRLEPSLRVWFLDALVESKRTGVASALRRAYGVEDDPETREGLVRALGFAGSDEDVAWLVERTGNERLRRAALLALSRLKTPRARAALTAAKDAAWADADLAAWIDHLLGANNPGAAGGSGR